MSVVYMSANRRLLLQSQVPPEVEEEVEEEEEVEANLDHRDSMDFPPPQRSGRQRSPLRDILKNHKMECFLALVVTSLWCTCFYICFVW